MAYRLEAARCLCGTIAPPARRVTARDAISGDAFTFERCGACGVDVLNPRPVAEDIGQFYPATYYAYQGDYGEREPRRRRLQRLVYDVYFAPPAERPMWVKLWRPVLAAVLLPIRRWPIIAFSPPHPRRIFEIGAAAGSDLMAFRSVGWETAGCELSAQACEVARRRGFDLQNCPAEEAVLPPESVTCVLMNNVFEHLYDPPAVLAKAHAALQDGGQLLLIVPNHDSWGARLLGGYWAGYDAPRHLFGFTPRTLGTLLAEHGFRVEFVQHRPAFAWLWRRAALAWLAERRVHGPAARAASWAFAAVAMPLALVAAALRRGDFIKVLARKHAAA
jgi:SAM-dependent methyltransferase